MKNKNQQLFTKYYTTGVTQGTVADTYNGLKQLIKNKLGNKNDIIEALDELEKEPTSNSGKKWLQKEIKRAQLDKNSEILDAAKKLMDEMKSSGDENHVMQAKGKFIAQANHGSTANVIISR